MLTVQSSTHVFAFLSSGILHLISTLIPTLILTLMLPLMLPLILHLIPTLIPSEMSVRVNDSTAALYHGTSTSLCGSHLLFLCSTE